MILIDSEFKYVLIDIICFGDFCLYFKVCLVTGNFVNLEVLVSEDIILILFRFILK